MRFRHQSWAGRDTTVVQIDNAAGDGERVLNRSPVVFVHCRLFGRQMRHTLRRRLDLLDGGLGLLSQGNQYGVAVDRHIWWHRRDGRIHDHNITTVENTDKRPEHE